MSPAISVIIPSSRPEEVVETIQGLERQDLDKDLFEILVVSPFKLDYRQIGLPRIRTIQTTYLYAPGKMRNLGAVEAQGDYLAFIDDDCIPPVRWLSTLLNILQEQAKVAAVGCRVISLKKSYWGRAADYALFAAYQYSTRKRIALGSAAIMFNRSRFEEVGGFDETLKASEDWDVSLKLQDGDWDCIFDPQVEVLHDHGCYDFLAILKKSYMYGLRSRLVVQNRHKDKMSWLAKLSLYMSSPWLYWLLIVPYAFLVCIFQGIDFIRWDKKIILYFPVLCICRLGYHIGVFNGLVNDKRSSFFLNKY